LVWVNDSIFGYVDVLNFLDDDIVLGFDVVIKVAMIVFEFDIFAEEPELIPLNAIVEVIFGDIFFELIDSDPWKIFASEGGAFFITFGHLVFESQKNGLGFFAIGNRSKLITHRSGPTQVHYTLYKEIFI
jgi:hypothetical protein